MCGHYMMDVVGAMLFDVDIDSKGDVGNELVHHTNNIFKAQSSWKVGVMHRLWKIDLFMQLSILPAIDQLVGQAGRRSEHLW